jgi:hypothetical protein
VGQKIAYAKISRENRAAEVARALALLAASRVVHRVVHTSANGVPLGAEADGKRFKVLFLDVGLIGHVSGLTVPRLDDPRLFYWHREARNANAEVDYVISAGAEVVPIEVKAATGGALKSMFQFLADKRRHRAIRLYAGAAGVESLSRPGQPDERVSLLSLPLFLAGQVRRLAGEFCW